MDLLGKTLGRYRIVDKLGEGGMGVVYRAEDTALERSVAIKILHTEGSRDPDRVRRFSQEAKAASALNHPNIVTVHDTGDFEGEPYLVMELVEGESLRTRIGREPMPLRNVLDVGMQAATALARAHESGITHRDLKPENLFIRPDGYVKILDFGLAKLRERVRPSGATATQTALEARTSAGSVVGTAAYMSPEQAQGGDVDGRSDIFSLALVLLECWRGGNPFWRHTALDTLHAIVHDPLPPFALPGASADWAFARIIEKALEKDPNERYQTMKDLAIDLRRLKQDSESRKFAIQPPPAPAQRRQPFLLYGLAALAILAALGAVLLLRGRKTAPPTSTEWVQLTNFTDSAQSPALSPDGKILAFIRGPHTFIGAGQLYVKLLPSGDPAALTHDKTGKMSPVFSPDGSRIAYTALSNWSWDTWVVPVLGGEPRKMLANASGLTWAGPQQLLFSEMRPGEGIHMRIVTASESRTGARDVYVPPTPPGMAHRSYLSPDGKWVLLAEMDRTGWLPCRVVPFDGSSAGRQVGPPQSACTSGAWSPDGQWIYLSAGTSGGLHLWRQRGTGGAPEQITFGATEEQGIAMAPDGSSLVTAVGTTQSTIWVHDSSGEHQVSSEGYAILPSFSPDGKRLFFLMRKGAPQSQGSGMLWMADLASGRQERLLPDYEIRDYSLSPDGTRVAFCAVGDPHLWIAPLDGRTAPRQVASPAVRHVIFGRRELYLMADENGSGRIYAIQEDGSGLRELLPQPVIYLVGVSPDEKWVVVWETMPGGETSTAVQAHPASGGKPVLICRDCAGGVSPARGEPALLEWHPDGKTIFINLRGEGTMTRPKSFIVPLPAGRELPALPDAGIRSAEDLKALPGARELPNNATFAGPNASIYAYVQFVSQHNLYRIRLPN